MNNLIKAHTTWIYEIDGDPTEEAEEIVEKFKSAESSCDLMFNPENFVADVHDMPDGKVHLVFTSSFDIGKVQ